MVMTKQIMNVDETFIYKFPHIYLRAMDLEILAITIWTDLAWADIYKLASKAKQWLEIIQRQVLPFLDTVGKTVHKTFNQSDEIQLLFVGWWNCVSYCTPGCCAWYFFAFLFTESKLMQELQHRTDQDITEQTRTALGRAHAFARLNSLRFVSHW